MKNNHWNPPYCSNRKPVCSLPLRLAPSVSGVAVASQILCISTTLNKRNRMFNSQSDMIRRLIANVMLMNDAHYNIFTKILRFTHFVNHQGTGTLSMYISMHISSHGVHICVWKWRIMRFSFAIVSLWKTYISFNGVHICVWKLRILRFSFAIVSSKCQNSITLYIN